MSKEEIWDNLFLREKGPYPVSSVNLTIPIKILSEANNSDHWAEKKVRKDKIREAIDQAWLSLHEKPTAPCLILIRRIAPRLLDYDNLVYSMRSVTNKIAELILPGLAAGRADGDRRLKFEYAQQKMAKTYELRIEIFQFDLFS
jgi:hypothetical protein